MSRPSAKKRLIREVARYWALADTTLTKKHRRQPSRFKAAYQAAENAGYSTSEIKQIVERADATYRKENTK
jgi:hypothetical protein